eukprot:TRINITY_DN30_c0_g2_i1.p1 TRINITY_DN30_c0_g2~~TRINITY_DN30_c0_g2_i1.p1  ORF type:complete len:489 (+),score=108.02 TRINITY_DN30_c0_g2_i1:50-1516(+)
MSRPRSKKAIIKAVHKATNRKAKPAKEKHVRQIIIQTYNSAGSNEDIIRALTQRLDKQNWAVVLKSLIIFHRCFREGDSSFIESLKTRSSVIFALRRFSQTAPQKHLYTVFVTKYAKYLEEKVSVLRLLGTQFEKDRDACKDLDGISKAFKLIPKLQSQLNALCNCKMRSNHVGSNPLIHRTYYLLIKDSLVLYQMLNDGILQLLEMFWSMGKKDATKVLNIYKLFVKETDALIGLYDIGRNFVKELPKFNEAETSIIPSMEKYVDDLDGDVLASNIPEDEDAINETLNSTQSIFTKSEFIFEDSTGSTESTEETSSGEEEEFGINGLLWPEFVPITPAVVPNNFGNPFGPTGNQNSGNGLFGGQNTTSNNPNSSYGAKIDFITSIPTNTGHSSAPANPFAPSAGGNSAPANPFGPSSTSSANPFGAPTRTASSNIFAQPPVSSAPAPVSSAPANQNPWGAPATNNQNPYGGNQTFQSTPTTVQNPFM